MSKYTVLNDKKADEEITKELNYIVKSIVDLLNNRVISILLVGGFGRGEGGVIWEDSAYRPVNDYDIIIIVKNSKFIQKKYKSQINNLNKHLDKILKVKQVDLAIVDYWKLFIPSYSVARYENKNGYKLLYGKKPLMFATIPAFLIPQIEGTKYFRTRASGLLISALMLDGYGKFPRKVRNELIFLEINKAYLAIGDSFLIKIGKYHYSYQERKKRVLKYYNKYQLFDKYLLDKYLYHVENKLRPDFTNINCDSLSEEWSIVANDLISSFLKYEINRLNHSFRNLHNYRDYLCKSMKRNIKSKIIREEHYHSIKLRIQSFFLLKARIEGNKYFVKNKTFYNKLFQLNDNTINNLSELIAFFLRNWHPEGIIGLMNSSS